MPIIEADWYDYPQYFDLAFRDETRDEARFLEAAFMQYSDVPVSRVLEPACGSGRLVSALAARGFEMLGFDLSEPMLDYARRRLARRKLAGDLFRADMVDFRLPKRVDAAYNTFNSFRHLLTEEAARRHLQCMARAVRPGGIYILGLHLLPPDASEECTERWTAKQGKTQLTGTLRVTDSSRRRRLETLRISLRVRTPKRDLRLRTDFTLRMYTAGQLRSLLASVPEWELCDVYDFWYDLFHPLELDDEMSDTVLILKRRKGRAKS